MYNYKKPSGKRIFTDAESLIIKQNYPTSTAEQLLVMLPGKKVSQIRDHAIKILNIRKENNKVRYYRKVVWTEQELITLEDMYSVSTPAKLLELFPGKIRRDINAKAWKLGLSKVEELKRVGHNRIFTKEESQLIKDNYATCTDKEMLKLLPGKTSKQISGHAFRVLNVKKDDAYYLRSGKKSLFTIEEEALLVERYATSTNEELLQMFPGRTRINITAKAFRLGVSKTAETRKKEYTIKAASLPNSFKFTAEECQIIKDNYTTMFLDDLMKLIPTKTRLQISSKASYYGLKQPARPPRIRKSSYVKKQPEDKLKPGKKAKEQAAKPIRAMRSKAKPEKQREPVFKTRNVDYSQLQAVTVDHRTTIYVGRDKCPVEAREQYLIKQQNKLKKLAKWI